MFDSRGLRSSRAAFRDGPAVPEATWPRNGCADDAGFLAMNSLLTSRRSNQRVLFGGASPSIAPGRQQWRFAPLSRLSPRASPEVGTRHARVRAPQELRYDGLSGGPAWFCRM